MLRERRVRREKMELQVGLEEMIWPSFVGDLGSNVFKYKINTNYQNALTFILKLPKCHLS
ncbi:hypothetical protein HanRHA438_Chr14g0662661 [Helianthus annuus]|nr:hypothetical protein HanIR_Chr14g0707311 [Helianthus annuus]KAJ0854441.1 hypothetical protein HanRHA438_Chr14g0662661 [Helianthus annuus]